MTELIAIPLFLAFYVRTTVVLLVVMTLYLVVERERLARLAVLTCFWLIMLTKLLL